MHKGLICLQKDKLTIFEDIFEAIRYLENANPVLNLKDKDSGYLPRRSSFNLMKMPDETVRAFPPNMFCRFYRGEHDLYPNCLPSIYRVKAPCEADSEGNRKSGLVLIDNLKLTEFELITRNFPQVQYAIEDYCNVDYEALAQHYELNTELVDLTCDIAVTAFFATNRYNAATEEFKIKEEGTGCLRVYVNVMVNYDKNQPFRLIGLQPFQRPGLQSAFAFKLEAVEDFSSLSTVLYFKQNPNWNRKLHETFYSSHQNILFPKEEIATVANQIKESNVISQQAINAYCRKHNTPVSDVIKIIKHNEMTITDELTYSLTRQQKRKLERQYKGRPYGDVNLRPRLTYTPRT